jgi:serine/threonine protein kinase
MPLATGARLGPYEVLSPLGAGGMGEVYKARDTRLDRDVAIKILPDAFALDGERVARFQREAKVLASLNHPHIAAIYGLEDADGVKALVMELVEGEDLAQRLARGAVPLDEALPIAKQIAEALEAAHEQAIIHRDLKPANIKVRSDGTVKVLDFGLAKAFDPTFSSSPSVTMSPTISIHATQAGVLLGTAAYMPPEQAKGKPVDKRADLWSFGCVLFEMLTRHQPFEGETISDVLARIIEREPDWNALPAKTPRSIRTLLRRCLEKDPRRRLDSAAVARLEIEEASTTLPQDGSAPDVKPRRAGCAMAPVGACPGCRARGSRGCGRHVDSDTACTGRAAPRQPLWHHVAARAATRTQHQRPRHRDLGRRHSSRLHRRRSGPVDGACPRSTRCCTAGGNHQRALAVSVAGRPLDRRLRSAR